MGEKGPKKCFVFDCSNTSHDPRLIFYHFPRVGKNNVERVRLWAKFAQPFKEWTQASGEELNKLHSTHKYICSVHFKEDCFLELHPNRLRIHCLPTIRSSSLQPASPVPDPIKDIPELPDEIVIALDSDDTESNSMELDEDLDETRFSAVTSPAEPISHPSVPHSPQQNFKLAQTTQLTQRKRTILKEIKRHRKEIMRLKEEYKLLEMETSDAHFLSAKIQNY